MKGKTRVQRHTHTHTQTFVLLHLLESETWQDCEMEHSYLIAERWAGVGDACPYTPTTTQIIYGFSVAPWSYSFHFFTYIKC